MNRLRRNCVVRSPVARPSTAVFLLAAVLLAAMPDDEGNGAKPSWQGLSLHQPDRFDFENAGSWPTWLSLFEDYAFASGLRQASGEVQVRTLLYCMGPEARPLLATFGLGDAPTDYNVV
ncbi:uncharacterized protein ISCGN_002231 [Ixodes scapularis]